MLTLICGLATLTTSLSAQQSSYVRQPGYWTFGLNGGAAYQDSDVPLLLKGWGAGATLAKNLYYSPDAPLSFDLRGRFLYSQTYGLDHQRAYGINHNEALNGENELNYTTEGGGPGFVYQNHETKQGELGLEGVFTFNQLRERHNVLFSLYGGLNLDWYKTKIDQRDANGQYDAAYTSIDPSRSIRSVRNELRNNILDGDYETNAHGFTDGGKVNFMPSLGLELGYQLTPTFSMGLGHKITFARNDLLDGHQWNNNNTLTGDNDIHHYTSLHMRWEIQPEEKQIPAPLITITQPDYNPHTTGDPNAVVRANIKHVNSAVDVSCTVNGRYQDFDFRGKNFTTRFILEPGSNEVVITARNTVGSDSKKVIIIYQEEIYEPEPENYPVVRFNNPPQDNYRVSEDQFIVRATVQEVENENDVRFFVNNNEVRNFSFNAYGDDFSATVNLRNGKNTFRIEGRNNAGKDMAQTSVIFEEEIFIEAPTVNITQPNRDNTETADRNTRIRANITGVNNKQDVRFEFNGRNTSNFSFDGYTFISDLNLNEGRNTIRITANNEGGQDSDETTIYYQPLILNPPTVIITRPSRDIEVEVGRTSIRADIRNVNYKNDIELRINGRTSTNFDWNAGRGSLTADINLRQGENTINIRARNADGEAEDQVRIRYEIPVTPVFPPRAEITSPHNRASITNATIRMTGRVDKVNNRNGVNLYLNGREIRDFSFRSGRVEANLRLKDGNNTIRLVATNIDGSDQDEVRVNYSAPSPYPEVTINRPTDNRRFDQPTVDLEARVVYVEDRRNVQVILNGRNLSNFSFNSNRNEVSSRLNLREGKNTIRVTGKNDSGSAADEIIVYYEKQVARPTVNIIRPNNNSTTDNPGVSLSANTTNVASKQDVSVYLNGRSISNFTFFDGTVSANLNLREGRNTIRVTAKNQGGSADDEVRVTYQRAVPKPTVNITRPANNSTVDNRSTSLNATVRNVENKQDIKVYLNGRSTNNFDFRNGTVSANLNLVTGQNTLRVTAKNNAGSAEDQVRVTYRVPVSPPKVTITQPRPSRFASKVKKADQTIKASITNVERKEDVGFIVNGKSVRDFSYSDGQFTANIKLVNGKNTIKVTGQNSAGKDEDQVTLTYIAPSPILKPTVSISSPSGQLKKNKVILKAQISNVAAKKDITVLLDGKPLRNFNYSGKVRQVTANFVVKAGNHTITVIAKNQAGEARDETNFSYSPPTKPTVVQPEINSFTNSAPVINPMRPNSARTTARATLSGVSSKKEISMTVNGKSFTNFTFNPKDGKLVAPITLVKGKNNILLKATTAGGMVKKSKEIEF